MHTRQQEKLREAVRTGPVKRKDLIEYLAGRVSRASITRALGPESAVSTRTLNEIILANNALQPDASKYVEPLIEPASVSPTSVNLPASSRLELDWLTAAQENALNQTTVLAMAPTMYAILGALCLKWAEENCDPTPESDSDEDLIDLDYKVREAEGWELIRDALGGFSLQSILRPVPLEFGVMINADTVFASFLQYQVRMAGAYLGDPRPQDSLPDGTPRLGLFEKQIISALGGSVDAYDALYQGASKVRLKEVLQFEPEQRALTVFNAIPKDAPRYKRVSDAEFAEMLPESKMILPKHSGGASGSNWAKAQKAQS